jgi:hypothetical protein
VNLSPCISATQVFQVRGVAYDEQLADRIRSALATVDGVSEPKMFGGVAFMVHGNMTVGIVGTDLMVRVRASNGLRRCAEPTPARWIHPTFDEGFRLRRRGAHPPERRPPALDPVGCRPRRMLPHKG